MKKFVSVLGWLLFYVLSFEALNLNIAFNFEINFLLIYIIFFYFSFGFWPTLFLAWFSGFILDEIFLSHYYFWLYPLVVIFIFFLSQFFNLKYFNSRIILSGLCILFYYLLFLLIAFQNVWFYYFLASFFSTLIFDLLAVWVLNKIKNATLSR